MTLLLYPELGTRVRIEYFYHPRTPIYYKLVDVQSLDTIAVSDSERDFTSVIYAYRLILQEGPTS